ncbi:DUF6011 domain-containing protein [Streptomyces sp. DSM 44917]|uniref:DUF6011 domain-containing protein n=1 Tax=Streptomyces boetiae TaxID=3075541 RepID=A0ABU2L5M0_9ACTN|nr:DUF6011 domain-containing protein [Streptomyces sp. DSM 44917]MDT0306849.1 DUF6011 domain-containing protein [Streptomyces sp. DSM 44917]
MNAQLPLDDAAGAGRAYCSVCGRRLRSAVSRARGTGPDCARKLRGPRRKTTGR